RARTAWPCRIASSTTRRPMLPVAPTTNTVMCGMVMTDSCRSCSPRSSRSFGRNLVDGPQSVEGAGIADERQQLGQDVDQPGAAIADMQVGGDVALDLGIAAAERDEQAEGEEFASRNVEAGAGVMVAEAIGRQVALDVHFVGRRRGVELLDHGVADDVLLDREALVHP